MKNVDLNCEISFVKVSSYEGTKSTGKVNELIGLNSLITNKHVVILEDIVDTGLTIERIVPSIEEKNPLSIQICTLLFKEEAFKGITPPKYIGFTIPNKFVVGYGLDFNEKGRNLDEIYQLKNN
jgi:hypoxanthine phosphoribosyltransferase